MEKIEARYAKTLEDANYFKAEEYKELMSRLNHINREREMIRERARRVYEVSIEKLKQGKEFTCMDEVDILREERERLVEQAPKNVFF